MTIKKPEVSSFQDNSKILEPSYHKALPKGFGKCVNDYLNHFVTVGDAKAVAFLALNFIVIQFLVKDHFYTSWGFHFHLAALGFLSLSVFAASCILFPRLTSSGKGLIFWEDINKHKDATQYENELLTIQDDQIEREYLLQNFYVSKILHKKMRLIQYEIILFLVGAWFAILSIIVHC